MTVTRFAASALMALVLMSPAHGGEPVVRGELGKKLDQAVQEVGGPEFWGTVLVAQAGEIQLAKGYGFADYDKRPNTPDTLFELASTTKPITACAILRLVQAKKLGLKTTLGDLFKDVPAEKRGITVHDLLTHTSGIDNNVGLPYGSPASRDEFVRLVLDAPMKTKPGEAFAYFNSGYAMLAAIVEVVTGQSFEAFVETAIFAPAGMRDTGFINDEDLDRERATTRLEGTLPDATCVDWFYGWGYRGMGGVVTTAPDMLKLDRALRSEDILTAKSRELAYLPRKDRYALGWLVGSLPDGSTKVEHSGSVAGYGINYVRHLEQDAVVIVLSNGKTDLFGVTRALEKHLAPKSEVRAHLDLRGLSLSTYKAAELKRPTWKVTAKKDRVILFLLDGKLVPVTIQAPAKVARRLLSDLERLIPGQKKKPKGAAAGLYLGNYQPQGNQIDLAQLSIKLEPRYTGVDMDGKEVTDDRITLTLVDESRKAYPVMAKLDLRGAKALAKAVKKALKKLD